MRYLVPLVAVLSAAALPAPVVAQATFTVLERHDFGRRTDRFDLPGRLAEISGLATTPDGRLFAHDDERATVYQIDPATGDVVKRFSLGNLTARLDFEGIAIVGERFFMVTSRGVLYEFREGGDRQGVPYRPTDTLLGAHCEIEGLDFDPVDDALLFACKVSLPDRGTIVVHRIPLDPERDRLSPLEIPRGQLPAHGVREDFEASAIAVDPTGTLILVSGSGEALIEVDRTGRVLAGLQLDRNRHAQPEGLAFGPDGTLYIADEENARRARITVYARARGDGGGR